MTTPKVMDFKKSQISASAGLDWVPVPHTSLKGIMQHLETMLKMIGPKAGVAFTWSIAKDMPEKLETDPVWLTQCCMNLVVPDPNPNPKTSFNLNPNPHPNLS